MKRFALSLVITMLAVGPLAANTRTGTGNQNSIQNWRFTPLVDGEADIVLSSTNANANLFMILVCGTSDPLVFGISGGSLDRVATMKVGLIAGLPCLLGVTSFRGSSGYRIHFNHSRSITASAAGRTSTVLEPLDDPNSLLAFTADQTRLAVQRTYERSR